MAEAANEDDRPRLLGLRDGTTLRFEGALPAQEDEGKPRWASLCNVSFRFADGEWSTQRRLVEVRVADIVWASEE